MVRPKGRIKPCPDIDAFATEFKGNRPPSLSKTTVIGCVKASFSDRHVEKDAYAVLKVRAAGVDRAVHVAAIPNAIAAIAPPTTTATSVDIEGTNEDSIRNAATAQAAMVPTIAATNPAPAPKAAHSIK
jgi:hypothetical protein